MKSRKGFRVILLISAIFFAGCDQVGIMELSDIGYVRLEDKYSTYYTIGAAIGPAQIFRVKSILDFHFNRLTCENDMKFGPIHPDRDTYNFTKADAVADYARARNIKMTGHTLIWHSQLPANDWPFAGLTPGTQEAKEALKTIMKNHIDTLVERYYDVIDNWDVVNEAVADDGTYRTSSKWYEYFGSEEYIYWAFKYTKDALEAVEAGGSTGKLYYNDYNIVYTTKRNKILDMVTWLRGQGATVDGVGIQAHWNLGWPGVSAIQTAISDLEGANLKVKISEIDISVYDGPDDDEIPYLTPALEQQQADRYGAIFAIFRHPSYAPHITSVTFWGVSDDMTWLDNFPVPGRNDYPLLFNDAHEAKLAYNAVIDF